VDVILCAADEVVTSMWKTVHTVVFGPNGGQHLPGPASSTVLCSVETCTSEEHVVMSVPPSLEGPLKGWISEVEDPRGMMVIREIWPGNSVGPERENGLAEIGLVMARSPWAPLAIQFLPEDQRPGVAWFPNGVPNPIDWVRSLLHLWAEHDPERLPGLRDWEASPQWMTPAELSLSDQIYELRNRRKALLNDLDLNEAALSAQLLAARDEGNRGPRMLLTSKDDELVRACATVLSDMGFTVRDMDRERPSGASKREDLRLSSVLFPNWHAIVEIKGYGRSGGKSSDLQQLANHAAYYAVENGRLPDMRIYIVNGKIDTATSPDLRGIPFSAEDLAVFESVGGLVVPTTELFKLHREVRRIGKDKAQRLIFEARGLFAQDQA
jgi:hypothetical protein